MAAEGKIAAAEGADAPATTAAVGHWAVVAVALEVVAIDQATKFAARRFLTGGSVPVIPGFFNLSLVFNRGAAWGMMQGRRFFFIGLTIAVCALLLVYLIKRRKELPALPRIILALILAGAVGNLIDRIALGYVRDMIYFVLIDFPIFNVADSALTIGCVLLCINVLFMKDRTFPELTEKRGKSE